MHKATLKGSPELVFLHKNEPGAHIIFSHLQLQTFHRPEGLRLIAGPHALVSITAAWMGRKSSRQESPPFSTIKTFLGVLSLNFNQVLPSFPHKKSKTEYRGSSQKFSTLL